MDVFDKIQNVRAAETVAGEIGAIIRAGKYSEGSELPSVRYLMRRFGRSYGTIRDALQILAEEGVIVPSGYEEQTSYLVVRIPTEPAGQIADLEHILRIRTVGIIDIVEYMTAAEPELVKWSATRSTWEDVVLMERQLENSMSTCDDAAKYFISVMELHYRIVQGAHNPLATMIWKAATTFLKTCAAVISYDHSKLHTLHRDLLNAIRSHDTVKACDIERKCWAAYDTAFTGLLIYDSELGTSDSAAASGKTINRSSQKIYEQIRERIIDGTLCPGETLPPERSLAESFGRSRPVVREALRRLAIEKYITIVPRSGIVVNNTADDELKEVIDNLGKYDIVTREDLIELRLVSETITAGLAASRRNDKDIEELSEVIRRSHECINNRQDFMSCGIEFNEKITVAAHNGMAGIVSRLTETFMSDRFEADLTDEVLRQHYQILEQHETIFMAVKCRDANQAITITAEHLRTLLPLMK